MQSACNVKQQDHTSRAAVRSMPWLMTAASSLRPALLLERKYLHVARV